MKFIFKFFALLKKNLSLIFVFIISVIGWAFFIFPFGDLSDLVGTKVAAFTQNQFFLQFSNIQLSVFPPGIKFHDMSVDTTMTGTIDAKELTISPSPASLFSKVPAGNISARGLFRGDVDISLKPGTKSDTGIERQKIEIHAVHLSLQDLRELGQIPLTMKGQLNVDGSVLTDLALAEQPEADLLIKAEKFEFPSQTVNTMMGPINLPDLKVSALELKGHLSAGKLVIEEGNIGRENDELRGTIKGNLALNILNQGGIQTQMGAYSFDVDLTIKSTLEDRLSLFLVAISQFKSSVGDSSRYKFKVTGLNAFTPPSMSALH